MALKQSQLVKTISHERLFLPWPSILGYDKSKFMKEPLKKYGSALRCGQQTVVWVSVTRSDVTKVWLKIVI